MIKRVIFDLDKTLIKWTHAIWNTLDETFEELNYPLLEECKENIITAVGRYESIYNRYCRDSFYEHVNKELNEILPINWVDVWLQKLGNRPVTLEPNAKEILEYLKEKYELVVLTNWFAESQISVCKNTGIYSYFDDFISTDEVLNKPNKEAFLKAIGNYTPEECMMIGDTFEIDILGAYQAGCDAIWYNPSHKVQKYRINVLEIDNLNQLKQYL